MKSNKAAKQDAQQSLRARAHCAPDSKKRGAFARGSRGALGLPVTGWRFYAMKPCNRQSSNDPLNMPGRLPILRVRNLVAVIMSCSLFMVCAMADEFDKVEELAHAFLVQGGTAASDIEDTYLGSLTGGLPNGKRVEGVADVAFSIRGQGTRYVQLFKAAGKWQALRILAPNQLAAAYPQLIDEYTDEYWRESARLEQRMASGLQGRLTKERRIDTVKSVRPRCFIDLKQNKVLCDIFYTTWDKGEVECSDSARVFARKNGQWIEIPGKYHSGMRIDPETGEIYTMIPEEGSDEGTARGNRCG